MQKFLIISEGGNAFDKTSRIDQENVQSTLDDIYSRLLPLLNLDKDHVAVLGSTGKRLPGNSSGDIDIGIDAKYLKIDDFKKWADEVESAAKKLNVDCSILGTIKTVSLLWPISNENGKQRSKFVQVDLMPVDDLNFSRFSKYTPQETADKPYYKSTIRNAILEVLAHVLGMKVNKTGAVNGVGDDVPVDIEKYHYNIDAGIEKRKLIRKQKKDGTYNKTWTMTDKKLMTSQPQKIVDVFFGKGHSPEDIDSPTKAWDLALKSPLLKSEENREKFIDDLRANLEPKLERQNIVLPPEIAKALNLQNVNEDRRGQDFSAIDSPRQALTKIHQLSGSSLKSFLNDFRNGLKDASLLIKTTPKIDGHPFRVAWIDGNAYIETSYSGLMGAEEIKNQHIPKHEQQFFDYVSKQDKKPLFDEIKKYGLSGIKILGELLANGDDFADDNGTITYVGTTYDASKIGKVGSVVIIDIKGATLEELTDLSDDVKKKIADFLAAKFSDNNASYFDINQFAQDIDVTEDDFPPEVISLLNSKDISDFSREEAETLKMQINASLTDVFKKKFSNPSIMKKDDKSLEGVAFELNGKLYGVHYQSWKDIRQGYYKDIDEIKDFVKRFLADVAEMPYTATVSRIVKEIRSDLPKYQGRYKSMYKKFLSRRRELVDKLMSDTSLPKFVRSVGQDRAKTLLNKFKDSDITDDINSLLDVVVGPVKDMEGKTVAIVPGSFRPPHKGHLALIEHYSKIADEVIVAVSGQANVSSQRPDKFGRTMPNYIAGKILQIYCKAYGLSNVKIAMTMKLMQWVGWKIKTMKNVKVMLGVSGKDDASRFSAFTSDRFKKENPDIEVLPIDQNAMAAVKNGNDDVSATYVRQHIDDKEVLRKVLPSKLSDKQFEEVYELMNPPSGKYPSMDDKRTADALFTPESSPMVKESGNAFPDASRIDAENVESTIEDFKKKFCEFSGISADDIVPLGSTGKRLPGQSSGDLDLGISLSALSKKGVNIEDKNGWFEFCKKFADNSKAEYYEYKSRGLTSVKWPISNVDGKQEGKFVQVDLIPHKNLKMLQWGMYQSKEVPGQDYDKSAVRALLLQAIVKMGFLKVLKTGNVPKEGENVPVKIERYEYKQNDGLFKMVKERPLKKDGTYGVSWKDVNKHKVTDDPQKIIDFIFGNASYAPDNLLSVREIWDAFVKSKFYKDKKMRKLIQADFEDKMQTFKFPYPKYVKFDESLTEDAADSKRRVAVIVTDGKSCIVGQAPQSKTTENGCDLLKGHAAVGEDLEAAAKREVYEEAGIKLSSLKQLTQPLKYSKGTTLTFFMSKMDSLPPKDSLKCKTFFEHNGKIYPEIVRYYVVPLDKLPSFVYKGLSKLIVDNGIVDSILSKSKTIVNEGGNAVSGVSRINKENVQPTFADFAAKVLTRFNVSMKDIEIVGSAGKKASSGDIDIGIGNVSDIRGFLVYVASELKKRNIECTPSYGLNEVSVKWPIANADGKQKGEYVQIDIMPVKDIKLLRFSNAVQDEQKTKYKTVVRNVFLERIAAFTDRKTLETAEVDGKTVEVVYERYMLITSQGLFRGRYSHKGKKPGSIIKTPTKTDKHLVTDDPAKIIHILFGNSATLEDAATTESCIEMFKKTPAYKDESIRNKIITATYKELSSRSGLDFPSFFREMPVNEEKIPQMTEKCKYEQMKTIFDFSKISYLKPLDETESVNLTINDSDLDAAKIAAYNVGQVVTKDNNDGKAAKTVPFNPKKFPKKAVIVVFNAGPLEVRIFFLTDECKWDSDVSMDGMHTKLSPDQMGMFFRTHFYEKLIKKLERNWPLSDELYSRLFNGIIQKEMLVMPDPQLTEAGNDHSLSNKDVDNDDVRDFTPSGRKIVHFSDQLVKTKDSKFYCWPDLKKVFRWSTWKDWTKIKPLCRMRIIHNGIPYGLSLSTFGEDEDYINRGFRGYSLDPSLPPVQWLTKEENISLMNLKIVDKFIHHCTEKISKFVKMDPDEILEKVNNPENLTKQEIVKTQSCIRKTLNNIIKEKQIDTFKWKS